MAGLYFLQYLVFGFSDLFFKTKCILDLLIPPPLFFFCTNFTDSKGKLETFQQNESYRSEIFDLGDLRFPTYFAYWDVIPKFTFNHTDQECFTGLFVCCGHTLTRSRARSKCTAPALIFLPWNSVCILAEDVSNIFQYKQEGQCEISHRIFLGGLQA